uniref:Uncharacterized protein n=1 Tax=Arundo donax TaxID=35708 RepID=A0A0A9E527_ARUDO
MVSGLCDSHQSTLGLPVTPAALKTWVGLTVWISRMSEERSSKRPLPYSYGIPCLSHIFPRSPPIHPVRPYIKNLKACV